jgi:hypothetical protein
VKEEFLHYLWKYSLYDPESLIDPDGNQILVIYPGEYNRDSGPDFFNSRISLAKTMWAGNVEIHTCSSNFDLHGHNSDPAYNNVILHIVAENDKKVFNSKGEEILTVEMKFDTSLYDRYVELINTPFIIACQNELMNVDKFFIRHWLNSLLIERFHDKSEHILKILEETGNDWEETFYRLICRYFGFRVNTEPFEMLGRALPFRIILRHADNRFQVEALLFGTAGLLDEGIFKEAISDEYYIELLKEFKILKAKYSIQPMHGWVWKFSRLRPANFPTLRISQLASMLSDSGGRFAKIIEASFIDQLRSLFSVSASDYWSTHFVFGREVRKTPKNSGSQATDIILINAVLPLLFVYGMKRDNPDMRERAIDMLEKIGCEENIIIDEWKTSGIKADSAFYSQSLIQLRNEYCKKRRCLECRIGNKIISEGRKLKDQNELLLEP